MSENNILNNFGENISVALIGASGGVGNAFLNLLEKQNNVDRIYSFARSKINSSNKKTSYHHIDICDEKAIEQAAASLKGQELNIIIVCTGFLYNDEIGPEKSLKDLDFAKFQKVFAVNTYGPALVAKHFLPLIPKNKKSVFSALSARVGSIGDNHIGGWYAYRSSKAALNMILRTASIEMQRRFKESCVIGLHPGTVETALSEPFRSNVKDEKLFSPSYAAECLLNVINNVSPEHSGKIFAWDGEEIPY